MCQDKDGAVLWAGILNWIKKKKSKRLAEYKNSTLLSVSWLWNQNELSTYCLCHSILPAPKTVSFRTVSQNKNLIKFFCQIVCCSNNKNDESRVYISGWPGTYYVDQAYLRFITIFWLCLLSTGTRDMNHRFYFDNFFNYPFQI